MDAITAERVRLARRDIGAARLALSAGDPENALYLTQQALEKALKARIQEATGEPPFTHALLGLAQAAGVWGILDDAQRELLADADPYVVIARYGATNQTGLRPATAQEADEVLTRAEELLEWLLAELK